MLLYHKDDFELAEEEIDDGFLSSSDEEKQKDLIQKRGGHLKMFRV